VEDDPVYASLDRIILLTRDAYGSTNKVICSNARMVRATLANRERWGTVEPEPWVRQWSCYDCDAKGGGAEHANIQQVAQTHAAGYSHGVKVWWV
jgi:hypothetical protein